MESNLVRFSEIADKFKLDLIVLFGSQATGRSRAESDFDIAVKGYHRLSMEQRLDLIGELERIYKEVDLVDIRQADPLLLACIAADGKPLYQRDPLQFDEFKLFAHVQYTDARPLLDKVLIENRRFITAERVNK